MLRTGLQLKSNKQRSKCHHVQVGYWVSGRINGAESAARLSFLPVPRSWEVWFPEERHKVPPAPFVVAEWPTARGSHLLMRKTEEIPNSQAGFGGAGGDGSNFLSHLWGQDKYLSLLEKRKSKQQRVADLPTGDLKTRSKPCTLSPGAWCCHSHFPSLSFPPSSSSPRSPLPLFSSCLPSLVYTGD